jgi:ribosomal protein S18 acetylase RimI-like enzyme
MEIIDFKIEHIPQFIDFINSNLTGLKFFYPHPVDYDTILSILMRKKEDQFKIILHEDKIIGYGLLRGWDDGYDIPSLGIMIDSNYRGMGIATMFMIFLESICKIKGSKQIRLVVSKENIKAVNTYKKLGYPLEEYTELQLIGIKNL